jgi:23S rRNA pseudouridine2605 synthase
MAEDGSIRLNKFLAHAGIGSRRSIEEFLKDNKVFVNKERVFEPGVRFYPQKDKVIVNGKEIIANNNFIYIIVNKPKGVVSTVSDELGRKDIVALVNIREKIFPVGRLDIDSTGLILLTNDGELMNKLIHPRYHIPKTYQVKVRGRVSPSKINKLKNGVTLKDGITAPANVEILSEERDTLLEIVLFEGKNRQIRRMCAALFLEVKELKRVAIGDVHLGNLNVGEFRHLAIEEIDSLKKAFQK